MIYIVSVGLGLVVGIVAAAALVSVAAVALDRFNARNL